MAQSDDLAEALSRGTEKVDRLREAGLRGLEVVTAARQAGLERERRRFTEVLGRDDPRVKDLDQRLEHGATRLRALKVEIARAGAVVPVAATDWVLHGYVWSADGSPMPDLTVALVDGKGQWLRELGFAGTDGRGYFLLRAAAADVPEAYVQVTDRKRAQVHRSDEAVTVGPGRVEYREVTLGGGRTPGAVPPEDTAPGGGEPAPDPEKKPRRRS
jgi:hypothetical protein